MLIKYNFSVQAVLLGHHGGCGGGVRDLRCPELGGRGGRGHGPLPGLVHGADHPRPDRMRHQNRRQEEEQQDQAMKDGVITNGERHSKHSMFHIC